MSLTASPLFGSPDTRSQSRNLVEFRAGKMFMSHGNMVHPDTRKGLVYVYQSADGLMHFCWKDRTTGAVEDDLIIFPDDAEYKHVPQCKTGRVYVLKFKSSSRKQFFWLQEPKTDKDEEFCTKVNEYLNNPPSARAARRMRHNAEGPSVGGGAGGGGAGGRVDLGGASSEDNLQSLLMNLNQDQLMELFGGVGGLSQLLGVNRPRTAAALQQAAARNSGSAASSRGAGANAASAAAVAPAPAAGGGSGAAATAAAATPPPAAAAAASAGAGGGAAVAATPVSTRDTNNNPPGGGSDASKPPIQLTDLQNILRGIKAPDDEGSASSRGPRVDLSAALNSESLKAVLDNPEFMTALAQHVPEIQGKPASEEVKDSVKSPQFQQAVTMFSSALQSGQLGPLIQQFDLGPAAVAAANSGDLEGFLRALDEGAAKKDPASSSSSAAAAAPDADAEKSKDAEKDPKKDDDDKKEAKREGGGGGASDGPEDMAVD